MTANPTTAPGVPAAGNSLGRAEPMPGAGGALSHRQIVTILIGLMMGMFLAALDQTIVASAIRTIGDDLHGLSVQAWVTTAYLITSTITTPLYGKLSDLYGRKPFFLAAIAIFIAGSALSAFATSMYMLAGFRAFQGLGAGGLFSLALAIIGDIVSPRERARYQGYFLAVFGTSSVLGPVIGGFFAGQPTILWFSGWRWVFLVNVPIGFAALFVVSRVLNIPHTRREHRIDWPGALALTIGLVPLLIIAEQGRTWGWSSGRALLCYVVGIVGLVSFVLAERRIGDDALLPLRFFRNSIFSLTSLVGIVIGMGMFGGISVLPLYLQIVRGTSPTESGLLLLPLTAGIMAASVFSGQLISKTGRYKIFPIVGAALMVVGMGLLSRIGADTPFWQTAIYMVIFGLGLGNVMQPITLAVQNAMPPQDIGVATSSATFFRQMGGTLGVAVFLSVLFSTVGDKIGAAFRTIAPTASFQAALHDPAVTSNPANRAILAALHGSGQVSGASINDTSFLQHVDPRLARPFLVGFSNSMDLVFLIGAGVIVVGFGLLLFLREVPLRTQSALTERGASAAAGQPAAQPAAQPVAVEPAAVEPPAQRRTPDVAVTRDGHAGSDGGRLGAHRGPAVAGTVFQPDGGPLGDAVVTLTDLAGRQVGRQRTAADGRYRLTAPTGGTYLLVCAAEDLQPGASIVALATDEVRRDVTLAAASRLAGRVVRADGHQPVPGATVTLTDTSGAVLAAAVTGPDGAYLLSDLGAGHYTMTAAGPGHRPAAHAVTLPEVGVVTYDVALVRSGELTGTVRAASDGRPLPEATVTLIDDRGSVVAEQLTDRAGGYHFGDLVPGRYTLTASGYAPVATKVEIAGGAGTGADVTLGGEVRRDGEVRYDGEAGRAGSARAAESGAAAGLAPGTSDAQPSAVAGAVRRE